MRAAGLLKEGLGSRFALRTYLLFCLCALVPVGLFGAIGYVVVSKEMRSHARERLAEVSKHYGLIVNERLIQVEGSLAAVGRGQLADSASHASLEIDERVRDVQVHELAAARQAVQPSGPAAITPTLHYATGSETGVIMQVLVREGGRTALVSARLRPETLWDADAVMLAGLRLCVSTMGRQLACRSADEAATPGTLLREDWALFLKPRYGAQEWHIEATQPESVALAGLRVFQVLLVSAAALAGFAALLLSAVQIRRSHQPLAELVAAVRAMRTRRFGTRVRLHGSSEFAQLGRAFNRLAAGLQRQFHILRAFSRIDRHILASPEIEPLMQLLLPRVCRLMNAPAVMVTIRAADATSAVAYRCIGQQQSRLTGIDDQALTQLLERPDGAWISDPTAAPPGNLRWSSAPILVKGELRGVINVGSDPSADSGDLRRHVQGLARRLAVALANEDRERILLRQAYYDELSGLPNRQLFKDRLSQEILRCQRRDGRVALFFIDLDHFKNVNDSLGHTSGDELLRAVAARLKVHLRSGDTLARLGGDEFTLIAPELDDTAAEALGRRLIESVSEPFTLCGTQHVVGASIGIAVYPRDSETAEALVRNADTAMYRAKSAGRGRVVFFEEAMNARAVRRLALEQRLRIAIAEGSLSLHYQPKFTTSDRRVVGVEALARWVDAVHGLVSPVEFIPVAEESGLIEALGLWSLREACSTMRDWKRQGIRIDHVAVNVSMLQLRSREFPHRVRQLLDEFGLQPGELEIEVTESMLAGNIAEVAELLAAIRGLQVRVAIDDFGTGYSSMVALQQLPADIVKIDRAFVVDCHQPQGLALLRALIAAGHALGKEVVAEGVETEEQLGILRACQCDIVQGYLLGKPMSRADLEQRYGPGGSAAAVEHAGGWQQDPVDARDCA